jgi:hypothetical protein
MFDFNYFKNIGINQLFISESLQILEHPNYIKSNYELNDYTDFKKDVLIVGYNFNDDEIKLICENTNTTKYLLILEQNIKISPELLNKDFIKFIVSNKKIEDELNNYNIRFLLIPTFCIWIDKHKFSKFYNNRNKILIYNGFSSIDEQYCNLRQSVEIKRNIPSKNYIYTGSLNLNNPNINKILNNVNIFLYLTNHKTYETEKLLNILNLLNVKIISNNYFINSINYLNTQELINIVKYNNIKDYTFNNFFNKIGIDQVVISQEKEKYGAIRYLYNLIDYEMSYFMNKDSNSKKILFIGMDNESYELNKQFTNSIYYLWTDEDEYDMKLKLNKYLDINSFHHFYINDKQEKILKQHNIISKERININLFMCKIYNYEIQDYLDINGSSNNILINNEFDDINDSYIISKFEEFNCKYKIYFFDTINSILNIKFFIDLSYYYNSKLDKILVYCKNNNIRVFTNNLPECNNIKNFDDLEDILLEINSN